MMKRFMTLFALTCCLGLIGCDDDSEEVTSEDVTCEEGDDCSDSAKDADKDKGDVDKDKSDADKDKKTETCEDGDDCSDSKGEQKDACDDKCSENEVCDTSSDEAVCIPKCNDGEKACGGRCLNLAELHLDDCDTCSPNYCDSNDDYSDGCDIDVMKDDVNNCGGCGLKCDDGQTCVAGDCKNVCGDDETECNGKCLNLAENKMLTCDSCLENYCNADGDWSNGCEVNALGDDANNCGTCGHVCDDDQMCILGSCFKPHRVMVMKNKAIYSEAAGGGSTTGAKYDYVQVTGEEVDGWYPILAGEQAGWVKASDTMDACDECLGRPAIDMAEKMLYNTETHMCTFDHYEAKTVPEFSNVFVSLAAHSSCNYGYDLNCANFVTAILRATNLMNAKGYTYVSQLHDHCTAGTDGYRIIDDFSMAKPGDIWMNKSLGHAELVLGYYGKDLILIGSNNFNTNTASSTTNICLRSDKTDSKYSSSVSSYQRVSYGTDYEAGYLCSRQ